MLIKQKKDKTIQIRISDDEKKLIKDRAEQNNLKISEYLLLLVYKDYKKSDIND